MNLGATASNNISPALIKLECSATICGVLRKSSRTFPESVSQAGTYSFRGTWGLWLCITLTRQEVSSLNTRHSQTPSFCLLLKNIHSLTSDPRNTATMNCSTGVHTPETDCNVQKLQEKNLSRRHWKNYTLSRSTDEKSSVNVYATQLSLTFSLHFTFQSFSRHCLTCSKYWLQPPTVWEGKDKDLETEKKTPFLSFCRRKWRTITISILCN